jgi:hypothetical protein
MAWIVTALFAVILTSMIFHYRRALGEAGALNSLLLLVLLNESTYAAQKSSLLGFIFKSDAKDAGDLSVKVLTALSELALRMTHQDKTFHLGVSGILWKTKEDLNSARLNREK